MAAIGELLSNIVSAYENISSLSGAELVEKCDKIRKNLKTIIDLYLTNVEMLKKEIEKTKGKTSQTEMVLNFLHHLVSQFPHPVFAPSSAQFQCLLESDRKLAFANYKDFIFWVCCSMFRLLSDFSLKEIQPSIVKLLTSLVELIKTKNATMLNIILEEIVQLSGELNHIHEERLAISDDITEDVSNFLESFKALNNGSASQLEVKSLAQISSLTKNCNLLIKVVVPELCQFVLSKLNIVWCAELFQLEHGDFELKSSCLSVLTSLLRNSGLPNGKILHYLMFCTIASIEMATVLMKDIDASLKNEFGWRKFLGELSTFMNELFYVKSQETESSKNRVALAQSDHCDSRMTIKHTLSADYVVLLSQCFAAELLGTKISNLQKSQNEENEFIESVLMALLYVTCSTRDSLRIRPSSENRSILEQNLEFCGWVLESKPSLMEHGVKLLSESLILELEFHSAVEGDKKISISQFKILDIVVIFFTEQCDSIIQICSSISDVSHSDFTKSVEKISNLCSILTTFVHAIVNLNYSDSSTTTPLSTWLDHVFGEILDLNSMKTLLKGFLDFLNRNVSTKNVSGDDLLAFYGACIRVVKIYSLFLHFGSRCGVSCLESKIDSFSKAVLLPFVALISIPWLEVVKLEDLSADLTNSGILQNTLVPISRGLKKDGLDVSGKVSDGGKMVIFNCVKAMTLLHEAKYPRWRSIILFKWATSMDAEISNVALSFLPFFIIKSLPGTGAFKGILAHLKTMLKKFADDFSHSNLLAICSLVHNIILLIQGDCKMVISDSSTNASLVFCKSCTSFRTSVNSIELKLRQEKVTAVNRTSNRVKEDVLNLLQTIIEAVDNILKDKWRSPQTTDPAVMHDEEQIYIAADGEECFLHLQNIFLKLCGDFFLLVGKNTVVENCRNLIHRWLRNLKFYSGKNFREIVTDVLNDGENSTWNKVIKDVTESILESSVNQKDMKTRVHAIKLIGAVFKASLDKENQEFCTSEMFIWALGLLCMQLSSSLALVQSSAYLELSSLLSCDSLAKYSLEICNCVGKILAGDDSLSGKRPPMEILEDVAHLHSQNPDEFLVHNMQMILPVVATSNQCEQLLKLFSEITGLSRVDILMQNFKYIFCHAVIEKNSLDVLFQFLEKETRIEKKSLLRLNFGVLLHHLVSYVSLNVEEVHGALNVISDVKDPQTKKVSRGGGKRSLSELLQPHFLGILTFFNCQLRSSSVTATEKKRIIQSLTCLLKLMQSKDVTSVRVKIINTLCLAQQLYKHPIWYKTCCEAWDTFVRCIEPSCLGSMLSQVAVTLLPLLEHLPDEVSHVLAYLVIEKTANTKEHLNELYFLPTHPALEKISKKVHDEIRKRHKDDMATHLTQAVQLMSHESSEVRVQVLTRLHQTLRERQEEVQRHHSASGREVIDMVMSHLVSTLLFGCRDNNRQLRLLCGRCLGLIGAIDPDRLILSLPGTSTSLAEFFTIDDPNFAFNLISELVKAFLAAKPTHQDISAFAIQELLKIYDCKEGPKDTHGRRLWRRFSETIKEVLEPHHTSRYLLKKTEIPLSNLKQPVLFRKPNMTFRDWVGSFCSLLMQMVYESNDSCTTSRVFRACSAVTRNDVNIALFLLPHTTLQALLITGHTDFIIQEVLAVLEHTEKLKDNVGVESESENPNIRLSSEVDQPPSQESTLNLLSAQHARGSHLLQLSAQAIFSVLDHITRWLRQVEIGATDPKTKASSSARSGQMSSHIVAAKDFLSKIPQLSLAQASYRCRAYRRALLHYEAHLRGQRSVPSQGNGYTVNEQAINFLQQLFVEMDEPDGVAGIAAVRLGKPTLNIQIKQLESTGKLQDACACYSHAIQMNPNDIQRTKNYVKCLLDLGQLSTAAAVVDGTISKHNSWKDELNSYRIEAAWRLGRWDSFEESQNVSPESKLEPTQRLHDWNTRLAELLLVVKDEKWDKFKTLIDEIYLDQTGPLSAASMESGSYQRGYKSILRLHMLTELEFFAGQINSGVAINYNGVADRCFNLWQERLQSLQTSFKPKEPVLSLQRTMLGLLNLANDGDATTESGTELFIRKLVGKLWLESAKQARKSGYLQMTHNALINAQDLDLPEFCIEQSKWLWNKGESHQALITLQKGVADHFSDAGATSPNEKISKAKAMLLVARLMEESSSFDSNTVLKQFREVVAYLPEWEDSHFHAAKYYDKLMTAFMGDNRTSGKANHLFYIMHHYGLSLCYGTSHIYESLTKLLTVWLDYEANVAKLEKANKQSNKEDALKLNNVLAELRGRLPAYIFLTAFSQLVSRICHPHLPTFEELKQVVAKVICAYPQQALWTMMAISKSSYSQRAQRCKEIFTVAETKNRKLSKILSDATRLTDKLLELCNKPAAAVQSLSITTHFKSLKRLVEEDSFSEILLPLQRFMTVTLPRGDTFGSSDQQQSTSRQQSASRQTATTSMKEHDPFPGNAIHIIGFEDTVEVLPSLQRPKKVSIRASDGKSYLFLCKPKDDLRKDARLMEFNAIVNKCLKLDSETRKRQLKIRTYAVVPLNEECGLIEWVPNTQGLRHILLAIYRARNMYTSGKILKSLQLPYSAPLEKKLDVFRNKLLPRHPAVFGDWFLATFPDPTSWYNARLAYARSTAVMSMVGYILGLGDRHGENILFDSMTGEAVHVDFNCLFNKGLTLDVPEIVPFRLTHNMTDAMGPMRHEGFFRCACETVMRLLRQQREPLLSVLKTFIYDPLVEWSKRSRIGPTNESGEILNEKALSHVSDIDKRLRGIAAKNKGLPLSVEGHVHYLIEEATHEEKLCQMYIGWASYM